MHKSRGLNAAGGNGSKSLRNDGNRKRERRGWGETKRVSSRGKEEKGHGECDKAVAAHTEKPLNFGE